MEYKTYKSKRAYRRFKRSFSSRIFTGKMGFIEFVRSWFALRKLAKRS